MMGLTLCTNSRNESTGIIILKAESLCESAGVQLYSVWIINRSIWWVQVIDGRY